MTAGDLWDLAKKWDSIKRGFDNAGDEWTAIIRQLKIGTPERQACNIAMFAHYIDDDGPLSIFLRILQSEAERSEVQ